MIYWRQLHVCAACAYTRFDEKGAKPLRRSYSRIVLVAVVTRLLAAGLQPGGPIAVQELAAAFERAGLTVSWETVDEYADMLVAPSLLARWFATA